MDVRGVAVIHFGQDDRYLTGPQRCGLQCQCPEGQDTSGLTQALAWHQGAAPSVMCYDLHS